MNQWDALGGWLYQRQSTPWQTVKQACQRLSQTADIGADWSPLGHASYWLRPLLELGVIEFDRSRIIACRPGIVWMPSRGRGLLFGYWTTSRIRSLRKFVAVYRKQTTRGPTCLSATGTRQEITRAAEESKVWYSIDHGGKVLGSLPKVTDWLQSMPEDASSPTGTWEMLSFRNQKPIWVTPKGIFAQPGLYRRKAGSPLEVHVLGESRRRVTTPDQRAIAMWYEYPPNSWIHLCERNRLLIPFGSPRLPLLVARALVTGAGEVAERIRHDGAIWWCYSHVSFEKAKLAAAILEQELIVQ